MSKENLTVNLNCRGTEGEGVCLLEPGRYLIGRIGSEREIMVWRKDDEVYPSGCRVLGTVGKGKGCGVSRRHLEIIVHPENYRGITISDLNSKNGTFYVEMDEENGAVAYHRVNSFSLPARINFHKLKLGKFSLDINMFHTEAFYQQDSQGNRERKGLRRFLPF